MSDPRGLALYVHWPFCQAKCPYCDFNSHVVSHVDHEHWRTGLLSELHRYATELPERVLSSIFFGGGTPSLMDPQTAAAIIETARRLWPTVNDLEITLEANPTSAEARRFVEFRNAGVNRVSVGLQALNDTDLKALGRLHTANEGMQAFELAKSIFDRCSFDLIYARQNQTLADWISELELALSLEPEHLSLYQLTIEPGTAFGDRHDRGLLRGLPEDDLAADLYEITQSMCDGAGLPAYEISNHAKPGKESRHNLTYWQSGDWIGIGPGAHGRFSKGGDRYATVAHRAPSAWSKAVEIGTGEMSREVYPVAETHEERLLMGLRLADGIDLGKLEENTRDKINYINNLTDTQLIEADGTRLRLTPAGRPLLNSVLKELLS